jgi:hypothetical protein
LNLLAWIKEGLNVQNQQNFFTCGLSGVMLFVLGLISTSSTAQNNTFSGTYTFVVGVPEHFNIQTNMFGQEVGFCPSGGLASQLPFGYSCNEVNGQNVLTGTLIANGTGGIVAGSNFVYTRDVNSQQCSSKYNPTPDCPYKVPAGIAWSSTASYVVGDEVDFSGQTFQAVKSNMNVPPNTSTCTSTIQPPSCDWDKLNVSATGDSNQSGSMTGTYTVQSNASAVSKLSLTTNKGKLSIAFAMVVPTAPLAVGQVVPIAAMPVLGNEITGSGGAVRIK